MEITLRKAARVVTRVDAKVQELASKLYETPTKTVFVQDLDEDIKRRLADARKDFQALLDEITGLIEARTFLRKAVGSANEANGVNSLVTTLKGIQQKMDIVSNLQSRIGDPALSDRELKQRLTALRERSTNAQVSVIAARDTNNVQFDTLLQPTKDMLDSLWQTLTSQADGAQEQLERINNISLVTIPDEVVAVLRKSIVL